MSEPAIVIPPKRVLGIQGPGWPDARGWVIAGFFALEFALIWCIREDGTLLANASFMQVVTALSTGGVLLIAQNMFGGTKSSSEMNAKVGDALTALSTKPDPVPVVVAPKPVSAPPVSQ